MINMFIRKIGCMVLLLGCLNLSASDSADHESDWIVPKWAIDSLNMPKDAFIKANSDFSLIMSEHRNEALGMKKGYDHFWDTALIYIKNDKVKALTLAFSRDFPKARRNCLKTLVKLIVRYGSKFEIAQVELDHTIAPDGKGYGLHWTTKNYDVLLKFGPLNNEKNGKFQLQIILDANPGESFFMEMDVPGAGGQIKMWRRVVEYFEATAPRDPELETLKKIHYTPLSEKEKRSDIAI